MVGGQQGSGMIHQQQVECSGRGSSSCAVVLLLGSVESLLVGAIGGRWLGHALLILCPHFPHKTHTHTHTHSLQQMEFVLRCMKMCECPSPGEAV